MATLTGPGLGLVVAAGQGRRFGSPKQFATICGRPVLLYSLAAFNRCPDISSIVVVTSRDRVGAVQRLVRRRSLRKVSSVVAGGAERGDSVRHGLALLPDAGIVAVHDAARPLVTPAMISTGIVACRRHGPVTYGRTLSDTVKRVRGPAVIETLDRRELIAVETPQFFPVALLRQAHEAALRQGTTASDDCALVERLGVVVRWLPSPRANLKITTRPDLRICAALL